LLVLLHAEVDCKDYVLGAVSGWLTLDVLVLLQSPAPSPQQSPQLDKRDIPLMSRLHARIKDLEKDKARLIMELDRRDYRSEILKGNGEHSDMEIYDALRVNNQYRCFSSRHSCTGLALMLELRICRTLLTVLPF